MARASRDRWADPALAALCALFTLGVVLVYHPWRQAAQGDIALFQAFGRMVADGRVPYRDFFDQKTPLTTYVNAFAAIISDWFHVDYILAARGLTISLFSLAGAVMFLLARSAGLGRVSALAAAGLFSAVDLFAWSVSVGMEPKVLATILGIAALLAAYKERWILSGLLCGLAGLAWQPEAVFIFAVGARAMVATGGRSFVRPLASTAFGFAAPILILSAYFAAVGAFGDFWADTITFNRSYYDSGGGGWPPPFDRFTSIVNRDFASDRWLLLLAAVGFSTWVSAFAFDAVRNHRRALSNKQVPMVIATLGVLAYSALNFGDLMDVLPFVPLFAFWTAYLISQLSSPLASRTRAGAVAGAIMLVAVLAYGQHTLADQSGLQNSGDVLSWQRSEAQRIEKLALLKKGDSVYSVNAPWLLLLTNEEHLGRYFYFWNGVEPFAHNRDPKVDLLTEPIAKNQPKLVVVGSGAERALLEQLERGYLKVDPTSLPPYAFPDTVEFWIRKDLPAAGSTAVVLAAFPQPVTPDVCKAADMGPGYRLVAAGDAGWRGAEALQASIAAPLLKLGFRQSYLAGFASSARAPDVICNAILFDNSNAGRQWLQLTRGPLPSESYAPDPALGPDAQVVVGRQLIPDTTGYAARITVARDYLLVSVTTYLADGTTADLDALVALADQQTKTVLGRFR